MGRPVAPRTAAYPFLRARSPQPYGLRRRGPEVRPMVKLTVKLDVKVDVAKCLAALAVILTLI